MARAYCSTEDVKQYLPPNIVSEGENPVPNFRNPAPETAKNVDIEFFIQLITDGSIGVMNLER
jgi:hypothetical protein